MVGSDGGLLASQERLCSLGLVGYVERKSWLFRQHWLTVYLRVMKRVEALT